MSSTLAKLAAAIAITVLLTGCGTMSSFANFGRETPIVYSGTIMDRAAMTNDQDTLAKFGTEPPTSPRADLPLSVAADTIFLPGTLAVAAYRKLFW